MTERKRKNNKRIGYITAILSAIMMIALCVIGANAAEYDFPEGSASVNVTYNGRRVLEGEAAIIDDVTYVPLRSFSELMGAEKIEWNDKTKTATSHYMTDKNFAELVVLKMFGSNAKSLNAIEDFAKIGLIAKSLPLNSKGAPKESMKMFTPNFEDWMTEETFDESFLREYFAEHQFLLMAYQYTDSKIKSPESIKFVGFKRVYFTDNFIETSVKKFWEDVRSLVKDNGLKIVKKYRADGSPIINPKSGTQKEAPNFPKEADYDVFMRGSASTSSESSKTLVINGLRMLPQEIWLAKRVTIDLFNKQTI